MSNLDYDSPATPPIVMAPLLVDAVNAKRRAAKLAPLARNGQLHYCAWQYAEAIADVRQLNHNVGGDLQSRVVRAGYQYLSAGECIAMGYNNPEAVARGWMDSPMHKEILLGAYSQIGAGVAADRSGALWWCATFGVPCPPARSASATSVPTEAPPLELPDPETTPRWILDEIEAGRLTPHHDPVSGRLLGFTTGAIAIDRIPPPEGAGGPPGPA